MNILHTFYPLSRDHRELSTDQPTPSFCPRIYWMTPRLLLWEGGPGPPGPLRLIVLYFCDNTRHLPCAFCSYFPVVSNVCVSSSPTYTTYFKVLCRAAAAAVAPPSHTILEADSLPRVRTIPICSLLLLLVALAEKSLKKPWVTLR